ncbi:MAG: PepSY-associated helix domain protein [Proteobacteria bacterium]|nr:PepSY-associated helix domain protein [Pseudomonadota bacterium]
MPFVYKLHYALALDTVGIWILGIVALIWTLDCFVAFYLTLPAAAKAGPRIRSEAKRDFWQRWRPAWLVEWSGSATRINFDLHRAGGLWLWAILLVFAWSSVYMNLWDTVYAKATRLLFDYHEPWTDIAKLEQPLKQPRLDWRQAQAVGARLMDEAAAANGFSIERPTFLNLNRELGVYIYGARSSLDIQDHGGHTRLVLDADSGQPKLLLPTGQWNGNTVTSWLIALHMANVFGLPYRIFVCTLGLVVVMLSVTGVIIWLRKRRAANLHRARTAGPVPILQEPLGRQPAFEVPLEDRSE